MGNRLQNEAKTPEMPREMSLDELDKLTRPGAADEAFKEAAAQTVTAGGNSNTLAFEVPAGTLYKGQSFDVGSQIDLKDAQLGQQLAPKGALEEVLELRMQVWPKLEELQRQVDALKTDTAAGPKLAGDLMLAKMRGTVYCPECEVQLDGGSNTAQVNSPYVHPMGSAAPKDCSMKGWRFEKPSVYLKRLPAVPFKKPIPA